MTDRPPVESRFFQAADGLRLHVRCHGLGNPGTPVICLPGLTRNARDFEGLAQALAADGTDPRPVFAFDYRGRGLSDRDPDWTHYTIVTEAADVLFVLDQMAIDRAAFVGTSRGGLILHLLAAMRPSALGAVVLNDVGPELGRDGLRQIVAYLEKPKSPKSFEETVSLQRELHGTAFPALTDADWQRFAAALVKADGITPDFDPALVQTMKGIDWQKPLPDLWPQFDALRAIPVLAIRGANSRLLTENTLAAMERRHPGLTSVTVPGQGHAPLLDTAGLPLRIAECLRQAERP